MGKYSTTDLYNESMSYHIRGGLRGINLDANNNVTNALFSMKLFYEDDGIYFDGNIRKQEWKSSLDNVTRSFTYRYDGSSRIKAGVYSGKTGENYTLGNVSYDNNGNIKNLIRSGLKTDKSFGIVDNLAYTYNLNSNKILKVDDVSNETASFTDATGNDYTYSPDGSLTSDNNKGISVIENNYLKLPRRIVKNGATILYQYSASGKKLKETASNGDVMDYVGNVIYKNGALYQISHDEGRFVNGEYEYNIKDHLGNLRIAFRDSLGIAKITQANSYGVFGEDLPSISYYKAQWKKDEFRFTGQENLPETGYTDFGARFYDNIVPRFITINPLAETSRRFSPYVYALNRPTMFTDPDGMEAEGFTYSNGYQSLDSRDETGAVSHEGAFENAGGGDDKPKVQANEKLNIQNNNDNGAKTGQDKPKKLPTASEVTNHGLNPNGDGIQVDYTLDGAYIGGKIFKPVAGLIGKAWEKAFGKVATGAATEGLTNMIPEGKLANHLFKGANKLADNLNNRSLISEISNGRALGVDNYGKSWFAKTLSDGRQIYTYAKDGIIKGAGINPEEIDIVKRYNLK